MPLETRAPAIPRDGYLPPMTYLYDLADFLRSGGEDDAEGFFLFGGGVGGPFAAGMVLQLGFRGGDVGFAEDVDKVRPGGFEIRLAGLMVRGFGGGEGQGGGFGDGARAQGTDIVEYE